MHGNTKEVKQQHQFTKNHRNARSQSVTYLAGAVKSSTQHCQQINQGRIIIAFHS